MFCCCLSAKTHPDIASLVGPLFRKRERGQMQFVIARRNDVAIARVQTFHLAIATLRSQ